MRRGCEFWVMLLHPRTSHVAAMGERTCTGVGEVGTDVAQPSQWFNLLLSTQMCSNPLVYQWNMKSTTRLSLNLVLHLRTNASIASQQLSLPKYSASWMITLIKDEIIPVVPHMVHQLSSFERIQVNCT